MKDKLYELAFKLRDTDFFEKLYPTQMFSVEADDDEILFVNVSSNRKPRGLSIYVGNEGFHSFMNLMGFDEKKYRFTIHDNEAAMSISALQVLFEDREMMTEEDRKMADEYLKDNPGEVKNEDGYPVFLKAVPYSVPEYITDEKEMEYVEQVLQACIEICGEKGDRFISSFPDVTGYESKIPVVRMTENGYMVFGKVPVPEKPKAKRYRTAKRLDEAKLNEVKNSFPAGAFECDLVLYPVAVEGEGKNEKPYYPFVLMSVDSLSGGMLELKPVKDAEKDANRIVNFFIDDLRASRVKPLSITVRNDRTFELLKYFAKRTRTPILKRESLPELDRKINELFGRYLGGYDDAGFYTEEFVSQLEDFVKTLEGMFTKDIEETVSVELKETLLAAADEGVLSENAVRIINAKLKNHH